MCFCQFKKACARVESSANGAASPGLALWGWLVDNGGVTESRAKSIPFPTALLMLSVAVCLGAAGPVQASALPGTLGYQAEQRQGLEHLLEAIQQAAKKLTDQLDSQTAYVRPRGAWLLDVDIERVKPLLMLSTQVEHFVREAILNLPPPSC